MALCRDRMYKTRHVTGLPRRCILGDGLSLEVDYATLDESADCRSIVRDAATRGDNVGMDEVDGENGSYFRFLLDHSEVFAARSCDTRRPEAFVVIQPCLLTR